MKRLFYHRILIACCIFSSVITEDNVTSTIEHCEKLEPRNTTIKDVLNVRIDEISYIGSMGDSVMAGFGMEGYIPGFFSFLSSKTRTEYRGKSFVAGADPGAPTLANFMKYYNPNLIGGSVGKHLVEVCFGPCSIFKYTPRIDNLNAARSGARSTGLQSQIDYLETRFQKYKDYKDKWKMIVLQVGANDACYDCLDKYKDTSSIEFWVNEVDKAVARIREIFPKTILYLLGNFKVSNTLWVDGKVRSCDEGGFFKNYQQCPCGNNETKIVSVDDSIDIYNYILSIIAAKYAANPGDDFGIIFKGIPDDQVPLPYPALSNVDCFHPSTSGHAWLAKVIWNALFIDKTPNHLTYDPLYEVVCPLPSQLLPVLSSGEVENGTFLL